MFLSRFVVGILSACITVLGISAVSGQDFPSRPIRIVTSSAGGGSDFQARQIAEALSGSLGQPVIVDNRGGILQGEVASKGAPDGYTLLLATRSLWLRPLMGTMPYDANNFLPVTLTSREVSIVAVHPSLPVKSVRELIDLAKAKPGVFNYGASSIGGSNYLAMELFKSMAGVNIVTVNHKSGSATTNSLLSGDVQVMIADPDLMPHVKVGKLRALAVTSPTPSAVVPGLPTVAASGLPGYEWLGLTGMWVPLKTPVPMINRLNQEVVRVLNRPDLSKRLLGAGIEVVGSSPEEFAATIKADLSKMGKLIKDLGIRLDN